MDGLKSLLDMLGHPAPGTKFPPHKEAGAGERVFLTPHTAGKPAGSKALRAIEDLCCESPELSEQLMSLYRLHDGVQFCRMPDLPVQAGAPAIQLLPVKRWDAATKPWVSGDMAWAMEECTLYQSCPWRVIGGFSSEAMSIVLFFGGEHEGVPQAGKCYCIGLDGMLGYEEVLAESFDELLKMIGDDTIGLLDRVGFTWAVQAPHGVYYGDPPSGYIPGARGHAALQE